MRCANCQQEITAGFPDYVWNNWLKLMHYFEHEYTEGEITKQTHEDMTDALMMFKPRVDITQEEAQP